MTDDRFPTTSSNAQLVDRLQALLDDFPNAQNDWDRLIFVAALRVVVVQLTDGAEVEFPSESEMARLDGLLERLAAVERACGAVPVEN
jgi:hypothetical protein